eukprot:scaffold7723_cov277-Pinguiococcus_pyrenoidosus.AAC.4
MSATIGKTPVPLESTEEILRYEVIEGADLLGEGLRSRHCAHLAFRFRESELGNFVADVMCDDLGAEIGLIQGEKTRRIF